MMEKIKEFTEFKSKVKIYKESKLVGVLSTNYDIEICKEAFGETIRIEEEDEIYKVNKERKYPEAKFQYIRFGWAHPTPFAKNCSLWNDLEMAKEFSSFCKFFDMGYHIYDMYNGETVVSNMCNNLNLKVI